jgi:hypothetical protein
LWRNEERIVVVNFLCRSLFSFFVSVLALTRRGSVSSFFLSPKDSQIYSSLCPLVEREKKDKKGQRRRNEHKKERDLFFLLVGQTKKRTKKQEGKKG